VALFGLTMGCVEQAEDKPTKEDEDFIKKNILTTPPTPQFAVNADLDGKVIYLGMDVSPTPVEAGKDVRVTHYWKVVAPVGEGWKVFTHISGTNKQGFANVDHTPVSGKYPAMKWKAGEIIRDQHTFRPPAGWNYDHLEVYTGLYKGQERMAIKSGAKDDNRVFCGSVPMNVKAAPPIKKYIVTKTTKPIKIDGKLDEAAWKTAPSTGLFVDTMNGNPGGVASEAKLLWDNQNLYIAFENQDTDIWSSLTNRDDKLWTQEAVEVMIDADGNGKSYIELQVAPNGTIFDTYLPTYRKYEDSLDPKRKQFDWNSKLKAKVVVDGTLNKREDQDKSWTVEMALPLADANGLDKPGVKVPPAIGDKWRLNMYRLDTPKDKPQIAVAWSAPMVGDFHKLDRFGEIVFGDEKGEVPAAKPAVKDDKAAAKDEKAKPAAKAAPAKKEEAAK
jgi:Carbohydrate family 9 binding domain-like